MTSVAQTDPGPQSAEEEQKRTQNPELQMPSWQKHSNPGGHSDPGPGEEHRRSSAPSTHTLSPSVVDTHTHLSAAPQTKTPPEPQRKGSVHAAPGTVVVGPGVPTWLKAGLVTLWTIGEAQTRPAPTAPFLMRSRLDSSNTPPSPDARPVSSQPRDGATSA